MTALLIEPCDVPYGLTANEFLDNLDEYPLRGQVRYEQRDDSACALTQYGQFCSYEQPSYSEFVEDAYQPSAQLPDYGVSDFYEYSYSDESESETSSSDQCPSPFNENDNIDDTDWAVDTWPISAVIPFGGGWFNLFADVSLDYKVRVQCLRTTKPKPYDSEPEFKRRRFN